MKVKILLTAVIAICLCACKTNAFETDLGKAKVSRITERLQDYQLTIQSLDGLKTGSYVSK